MICLYLLLSLICCSMTLPGRRACDVIIHVADRCTRCKLVLTWTMLHSDHVILLTAPTSRTKAKEWTR